MCKRKTLAIVFVFSAVFAWAEWERKDVFLLPDGNTVNGRGPGSICGLGDKIFVANNKSNSVSIIDLANENQLTNIAVNIAVQGITHYFLFPAGDKIVLMDSDARSISVIDPRDYSVETVSLEEPGTTFSVSGNKVFLKFPLSNNLFILDLARDNEIRKVGGVGSGWLKGVAGGKVVVWNQDEETISLVDVNDYSVSKVRLEGESAIRDFYLFDDKVLLVSGADSKVFIIDTDNNQLSTYTVGTEPRDVCISGNKAFVVNLGDFTVSIIDLVNGTQTTVGVGIVPRIIKEVGNNKVIVFNADKSVSIIDVNDHSVVTIPEAVEGVGIERKRGICSVGSKVFVPGEESVSVIDLVNNQVTKIRVGVPPSSIHSCGNNNLVVLHSSGPEVSFIDVTDYTVTTLTVGKYREFHISGDKVCFTLYDDNSVSIIDVNTHQVSKVEVGVLPTAICFAGGKIFVGVGQRDRVSIIDLGADFQITNVAVGDTPGAMCSSGDKVFVSNQGSNNVSIIDVNDYTVTNVEVGESPGDICFSGDKVFVVNSGDNSISVIDLAQDNVVTLARLSSRGGSIAAAGEKVVVTHGPSNQVSIIDLTINNEAITEVRVGDTPIAVCISNQKAFVANYRSNNVSIIDLTNMRYQVTSVEVGRRPIALCTNGEKVFVANEDSNDVSIIDVASERVTSVVEVGDNQWKICVSGNKVFVLRRWRSVAVIDLANNNRVEEVAVGESPIDIWVAEEKAFVANQFSGSVSILSKSSGSKDFVPLSASEFLSYPNPFNRECYLPLNGKCKIYNILGQLVREIKISRSIYWDGRDTRGREVPTGLYFYEVVGKGVRRIVMLR